MTTAPVLDWEKHETFIQELVRPYRTETGLTPAWASHLANGYLAACRREVPNSRARQAAVFDPDSDGSRLVRRGRLIMNWAAGSGERMLAVLSVLGLSGTDAAIAFVSNSQWSP